MPQLLCKMSLKTNAAMHVHGADGIHGAVLPNGNLGLCWGEAKLHANVTKAIDACFESLAPFLTDYGTGERGATLNSCETVSISSDPRLVEGLRRYFCDDAFSNQTHVEFRRCVGGVRSRWLSRSTRSRWHDHSR